MVRQELSVSARLYHCATWGAAVLGVQGLKRYNGWGWRGGKKPLWTLASLPTRSCASPSFKENDARKYSKTIPEHVQRTFCLTREHLPSVAHSEWKADPPPTGLMPASPFLERTCPPPWEHSEIPFLPPGPATWALSSLNVKSLLSWLWGQASPDNRGHCWPFYLGTRREIFTQGSQTKRCRILVEHTELTNHLGHRKQATSKSGRPSGQEAQPSRQQGRPAWHSPLSLAWPTCR